MVLELQRQELGGGGRGIKICKPTVVGYVYFPE